MKPIFYLASLAVLVAFSTNASFAAKKNPPFTGNWISLQYTNGREFLLKLQQIEQELIGWEGKLPANSEQIAPDLKGTVKGKTAEVEIQHRRGYTAHARLRLQDGKLVWQLLDADNRSNRYFPIASTLNRRDEDIATSSAQVAPANKTEEQLLWDLLAHADAFETGVLGEGGQPSAYFNTYKALLSHKVKADDTELQTLLKASSPAARVYAAAITWEIDHDAGLEAFKTMQADNASVSFKSGCDVMKTTVAEIARSFLEQGHYLDFPSKKY